VVFTGLDWFRDLVALRPANRTLHTITRDFKPCRLSANREGLKLEVNTDLYDDSDEFFNGESGKFVSFQDVASGNVCTEWKEWLGFVKEIVIPEQKKEQETLNLVEMVLGCFEKSNLTLPEGIELEVKQPYDSASNSLKKLLKMIDRSTLPFVATITVTRSSTKANKQVVLGNKITSLDMCLKIPDGFRFFSKKEDEGALPADWNIFGTPSKWRNVIISQYTHRTDWPTSVSLGILEKRASPLYTGKIVLANTIIEEDNFFKWSENWKGIHISDGLLPQASGRPTKKWTEFFLTKLGFFELSFKKVTCTKKNRSTFQMFKDRGSHRVTLRGWDIFHIFTLLTERNVFINTLEINIVGFDYRIETCVTKMKNLRRIIIKIVNKTSPNEVGYLNKQDSEEKLNTIKSRMCDQSTNPNLSYLQLSFYDHGNLWSETQYRA
jgi:hypothetical protein